MGFGHRVYKSYDPRAKVLRPLCHQVLDALGQRDDPLLKLAMDLERIALEDDYFLSRNFIPISIFTWARASARLWRSASPKRDHRWSGDPAEAEVALVRSLPLARAARGKPSGNRLAYPCPLLYPTPRRGHQHRHGHP